MQIAPDYLDDLAVPDHQFTVLEDVIRLGEHRFLVVLFGVNGNVGSGARAEMAAVVQTQNTGRAGTGHDGDLIQAVLAVDGRQRTQGGRIDVDRAQHVVAEALVHQQPDQVRITGERRAIRVIRGQENPPGIFHQQEDFQSYTPLQGIDEILILVLERHHAAAGVTLDIHAHPFVGMCMGVIGILHHRIAGGRHRLAEQNLAHIRRDVGIAVDGLGNLRRARGKLAITLRPITVELDMGEMHRQSFDAGNGIQRRVEVARHAEVAAMHMQRMRHAQFVHGSGQTLKNATGRDAVVAMLFVQIQLALVELEGADAAGVDHLDADALRGLNRPGHVVVDDFLLGARGHQPQEEIIAAKHRVAADIHQRRVGHFHVRLTGIDRQHGRFETGGVPHFRIAVTRRQGRRRDIAGAGPHRAGTRHGIAPMVFRQQVAGDGDLAAANMGVHVDGAGHDDLAPAVEFLIRLRSVSLMMGDDAPVTHEDVADFAIDAMRGVVNLAAGQFGQHESCLLWSDCPHSVGLRISLPPTPARWLSRPGRLAASRIGAIDRAAGPPRCRSGRCGRESRYRGRRRG